MNYILGFDVGGSHISAGLIDAEKLTIIGDSWLREAIQPDISVSGFVEILYSIINRQKQFAGGNISKIVMSVPGPFDYKSGISKIFGVNKLENIFGLNLKQIFLSCFEKLKMEDIHFFNDATSLICGEAYQQGLSGRTLGITLGTGFGSAFLEKGRILKGVKGIPESGFLYDQPFENSIADDYFSSRWFIKEYENLAGKVISSVKELVELAEYDNDALLVFKSFGKNLARFLYPWLCDIKPASLIIAGNISKSRHLFFPSFEEGLPSYKHKLNFYFCENGEEAAVVGAALLSQSQSEFCIAGFNEKRKTSQYLLPLKKPEINTAGYDIYPAFPLSPGTIREGFKTLAREISDQKTVIIDGYTGVYWDEFIGNLTKELKFLGKKLRVYSIESCLKSENDIKSLTDESMGDDDSIFGKKYAGKLLDFFHSKLLDLIKPHNFDGINILYGCGASLARWSGMLVYIDLPKNEIQFRSRAGFIKNLGFEQSLDSKEMYKRYYFVDWIVLNRHKEDILPNIDLLVDEQRIDQITYIPGDDFRFALRQMATNYFRVRPWFEPGPWGGQWIKKNIEGLAEEVPNYAWSFELISPENGLLLQSDNLLLECSFDFLMFQHAKDILGHAFFAFGTEFPIRFDFLDTYDGGNLSVQCHPRPDYIKENFGESFTQDETYYILDAENDAEVYLGFQEDIDPDKFKKVLENSFKNGTEIEIEKFVQLHQSKKHDLFLIPGGTIHASGKNNLVLEISSTPYIFTFKMYDWLRLDLDGNPRPINIDHAFNNLYFDRKGRRIKDEFISKPTCLKEGKDYKIFDLSTHKDHFYEVKRFEFENEIDLETCSKFYVCMLVEGENILMETESGIQVKFNYAETFVIPSAAVKVKMINKNSGILKLVLASVKDKFKI